MIKLKKNQSYKKMLREKNSSQFGLTWQKWWAIHDMRSRKKI